MRVEGFGLRDEGVAVALLVLWDANVCVAFAFDADNHVQCPSGPTQTGFMYTREGKAEEKQRAKKKRRWREREKG